jgi:type II secretory pathway predicted ATPase ExeA
VYLKHFGFKTKPFLITPETESFFTEGSRASLWKSLLYVLQNEEGIVKVTGGVGSGKTTVCRWLLSQLSAEKFKTIYIADPSLTRSQMLFALADGLNAPVSRSAPDQVVVAVQKALATLHASGRRMVLLIDEAHAMPEDTLDQIRLLSQIEASGNKIMHIVLFGPEELDHNLALPELRAVRDRITQSFRLKRLTTRDIDAYIAFKLKTAGYEGPPVFSPNALKAIGRLTGGVPRRINIIADKALLAAALDRRFEVRARDIATAAQEIKLDKTRTKTDTWLMGVGAFCAGATLAVAGLSFALTQGWVQIRGPQAIAAQPTIIAPAPTALPVLPPAPISAPAQPSGTISGGQPDPAARPALDPQSVLSGVADEKGTTFGDPAKTNSIQIVR